MTVKAYLEAIMTIEPENRAAAAEVYTTYRQPFLDDIEGAMTKELLVRNEDVQVIHGFDSMEHAKAILRAACSRPRLLQGSSRYGRPIPTSVSTKSHRKELGARRTPGAFFNWQVF